MDMGSYTQNMYDWMINAAEEGYDIDCDYTMLLEQVNSPDFFEPFSARLLRYISKRLEKECTAREAYLFLLDKMSAAGITPNKNTIKNWLNVKNAAEGNPGPQNGG